MASWRRCSQDIVSRITDHRGVERLSDVDSQNPVRFRNDLKKGVEREADKVRVADVLRMKVELRGGSALR